MENLYTLCLWIFFLSSFYSLPLELRLGRPLSSCILIIFFQSFNPWSFLHLCPIWWFLHPLSICFQHLCFHFFSSFLVLLKILLFCHFGLFLLTNIFDLNFCLCQYIKPTHVIFCVFPYNSNISTLSSYFWFSIMMFGFLTLII